MKKTKWVVAWKSLLGSIEIRNGTVRPVTQAAIARHRSTSELSLPDSYYAYCKVFGAGELTNWNYAIRVPDAKSRLFGIDQFNTFIRQSPTPRGWHPDEKQRLAIAAQCRRATFFASDICTSWYFWDPMDVTNSEENEYGIYICHREGHIFRLCDSFWTFINDMCLGPKTPGYEYSDGIDRVFLPAT